MTDILTQNEHRIKLYPKDMYPGDLYIIQRENQLFTFRKNDQGFVEILIESINNSGVGSK